MAVNEANEINALTFEERLELINNTQSHPKKLDMLKQLQRNIEFSISANVQMAQLLDMTDKVNPDMVSRALEKLTELSGEYNIVSSEVLKEEYEISEYEYAKKHHPVRTATKDLTHDMKESIDDFQKDIDDSKNARKEKRLNKKNKKESKKAAAMQDAMEEAKAVFAEAMASAQEAVSEEAPFTETEQTVNETAEVKEEQVA